MSEKGFNVAVVGATGMVGREMMNVLAERMFPVDRIVALGSPRSIGSEVSFGDKTLKSEALEHFDWQGIDLCLMSAGGDVSREWAQRIARNGTIVIDNSSAWRMDSRVPLIVPEVNADAVADVAKAGIIANGNCSTIGLMVAVAPIHRAVGIKRMVVSTYQSVSGAGQAASDELFQQTRSIFVNSSIAPSEFTRQIAFNVIPHIGKFLDDGSTEEEWKVLAETKKILDPKIKISCTAVRVPVFVGHSLAVNMELDEELSAEDARRLLRSAPGLMVIDNPSNNSYVTPVECVGEFATYVSRIREDSSLENGLSLWVVSDNLRKGAALNSVQIAEILVNRGMMKGTWLP